MSAENRNEAESGNDPLTHVTSITSTGHTVHVAVNEDIGFNRTSPAVNRLGKFITSTLRDAGIGVESSALHSGGVNEMLFQVAPGTSLIKVEEALQPLKDQLAR